jgi:hypothetical protein
MRGLRRGSLPAVLLLALPMSQLGHLLAYAVRFGPDAVVRQSTGAHAYFPGMIQAGATATGAALLAILLLVGVARFLVGLRNDRLPAGGWPVAPLLLTMLLLQLAIFTGQELAEASLFGLRAAPLEQLLGWGMAGQLPVALLAALGLSWISARVRRAVARLRRSRPLIVLPRQSSEPAAWLAADLRPLRQAAPAALLIRGPPFSPLL